MNVPLDKQREFVDFIIAACRLFGASELTAYKVIVLCLESLENTGKLADASDIRKVVLKDIEAG